MEHSAAASSVPDYQQQVAEFNELVVRVGGNRALEELIRTLTVRARMLSFDALSARVGSRAHSSFTVWCWVRHSESEMGPPPSVVPSARSKSLFLSSWHTFKPLKQEQTD